MRDVDCGPPALTSEDRARVSAILHSIYGSVEREFIDGLLLAPTWSEVHDQVCREKAGLFNALNLATLQTHRPAPLEAPAECERLRTREDFLQAWSAWYTALDESALPRAEAERKAEKNGLRVEDAFAGLLIFDLMSCAIVRHVFPEAESPFAVMSELTGRLPFATYSGKHEAAACFFTEQEADIVFVQEARCIDEHP
jgi:hypothetical protein